MTQFTSINYDEFHEKYNKWKASIDKDIAKNKGKNDWSNTTYGYSKYRTSHTGGIKRNISGGNPLKGYEDKDKRYIMLEPDNSTIKEKVDILERAALTFNLPKPKELENIDIEYLKVYRIDEGKGNHILNVRWGLNYDAIDINYINDNALVEQLKAMNINSVQELHLIKSDIEFERFEQVRRDAIKADKKGEKIWRSISGCNKDCEVSHVGDVIGGRGKPAIIIPDKRGPKVKLSFNGVQKDVFIHDLMAENFGLPMPKKKVEGLKVYRIDEELGNSILNLERRPEFDNAYDDENISPKEQFEASKERINIADENEKELWRMDEEFEKYKVSHIGNVQHLNRQNPLKHQKKFNKAGRLKGLRVSLRTNDNDSDGESEKETEEDSDNNSEKETEDDTEGKSDNNSKKETEDNSVNDNEDDSEYDSEDESEDKSKKKSKKKAVHRLVARAFKIPIPEKYIHLGIPIEDLKVCHIDGNKLNNHVLNLALRSASDVALIHKEKNHEYLEVDQYDLDDNYLETWISARAAGEKHGLEWESIQHCCRGYQNYYGSYKWKYTDQARLDTFRGNMLLEKQQVEEDIQNGIFVSIGMINGIDFSRYHIAKDGSRIINNESYDEREFHITGNYKMIQLWKNGKWKHLTVHKIINQVLLDGVYNDIIDHINENKLDNSLDNLRAVTHSENTTFALGKAVHQLHPDTKEIIATFQTMKEACLFHGISSGEMSKACINDNKIKAGFKWRRVSDL
jgi:hypothetical protein